MYGQPVLQAKNLRTPQTKIKITESRPETTRTESKAIQPQHQNKVYILLVYGRSVPNLHWRMLDR
jgi:hypothetical protein